MREVIALNGARSDIRKIASFWDQQEQGLGNVFVEFILAEFRGLGASAGMHPKRRGVHCAIAFGKFPYYAIFYQLRDEQVEVVAVIDQRRDPAWVKAFLSRRLKD